MKRKKLVIITIIAIVIVIGLLFFTNSEKEKKQFNQYTKHTQECFTDFAKDVEALNNGKSIKFDDVTAGFIAFTVASEDWNRLYYDLKENDRLPKEADLDYTSNDFVKEVKDLYYNVIHQYFLNDGKPVNDKEKGEIKDKVFELKQNMESFKTF